MPRPDRWRSTSQLLSARHALQKAPRRTVAAVAVAVASTVMRPVDAAAAQLPKHSHAKPAPTSDGEEATETELVERLRQSGVDRRRIKRQ